MKRNIVKVNFETTINGHNFKFKNVSVDLYDNQNGGHNAYLPMRGVSSVIRQYVKQKWPQIGKFNIGSDSFSMGDSVTVYLNFVKEELYQEIRNELIGLFQRGSFNGMIDMYEYSKKDFIRVEVDGVYENPKVATKYMDVNNRPKFDSALWKQAKKDGKV